MKFILKIILLIRVERLKTTTIINIIIFLI